MRDVDHFSRPIPRPGHFLPASMPVPLQPSLGLCARALARYGPFMRFLTLLIGLLPTPVAAADWAVAIRGGAIGDVGALGSDGPFAMNSNGMYRGRANTSGNLEIKVYENE